MTDKKELNLEAMEKVSGGETIELAGGIKPFISVPIFEKKEPDVKPVSGGGNNQKQNSTGGGGTNFSNTNDGGKQMNNQGTNNSNSNSGSMNW